MSRAKTFEENGIIYEPFRWSKLIVPFLMLIGALIYDIFPFDIIPDIPGIGYIDDLLVTTIATLNFLQKWLQYTSASLSSMLRMAKWVVIFTGITAVSILGLAVFGVARLFGA